MPRAKASAGIRHGTCTYWPTCNTAYSRHMATDCRAATVAALEVATAAEVAVTVAAMAVAIALSGDGSGSDGGESAARPVCGGPPAPLALLARALLQPSSPPLSALPRSPPPRSSPPRGPSSRPPRGWAARGRVTQNGCWAAHRMSTPQPFTAMAHTQALWRHPGCAEHRRCVSPSK